MDAMEIVVIVCTALFLGAYFGVVIYRKIKGLPSLNDECASEHKGKALVAAYRADKAKAAKKAGKAKGE